MFLSLNIVSEALAQAAVQAPTVLPPPSAGEVFAKMIPMFIMVFFVFYFLVFRPQQQKFKAQADLLASLKKGESVVSKSGIVGKITAIEDKFITLEISKDVKVKFDKLSIERRESEQKAA